ncbi:MAG: hypothetical protein JXA03_07985 [Bacteroidales bacterium]|nr:hypothetical protein [Bacteroidales bacterium]
MNNIIRTLLFLAIMASAFIALRVAGQVAINTDGNDPDSTAMLDVKSSGKGILLPRLTEAQIAAINGPADGLIVYNITDDRFYFYRASVARWTEIASGPATIYPSLWVCGMPLTDPRDGKIYETVLTGSLCWMAENLNAGTRIDGITDQSDNGIIEKYCFSDSEDSCTKYGGFYQWDEMMDYVTIEATEGICPPTGGWRLPSQAEWAQLSLDLGGDPVAGEFMKSTTGWYAGGNGNNSGGFNALPSGYRNTDGSFLNNTKFATHWSSTQSSGTTAWNRHLSYEDNIFHENNSWKNYGLSVRCVRDE